MAAGAEQILKKYWGYNSFKPLQKEIIGSILDGKDTLALLPTGGGKSVCYQVPALMNEGFCLVISPLIALMQDQVQRLKSLEIRAASIHSGMHYNDVRRTLDNAVHGAYKLLYISPERLQTQLFGDYMPDFDVSMIAIDEAHCISQWGHDFRPNYLKIADAREVYPSAPVLALTASATKEVQDDIELQLKFRNKAVYKSSFARTNIQYYIRYTENKHADVLQEADKDCGIIYCRSRKQTEAIGKYLLQSGVSAAVYHAGMLKDKRDEAQQAWMQNKARYMVATTAFGMGIDKPDVRSVLHYDSPEHLEAWYQEAGRAGRDGKPSDAITFYNSTDIKRLSDSIDILFPPEEYLRKVYQAVVEYLQIPIGAQPDNYYPFDLFDFSRKFGLTPAHAIPALKLLEQEGLWTMTEAVYHPATIQFTADRHTLDDLKFHHPDLAYVAVGLLRMYNTIFHFPTTVRETAIAKQLKMNKEELIPIIERLDKMELLEYIKPGEGPQLFFHHYRVDSRYLIINHERIGRLRKRHVDRTMAMIGFLENTTLCRERILLTYFGEEVLKDCGHCDVCSRKVSLPTDEIKWRTELLNLIEKNGTIAISKLTGAYPAAIKQELLSLLRLMIDDGVLSLSGNNEISLSGRE